MRMERNSLTRSSFQRTKTWDRVLRSIIDLGGDRRYSPLPGPGALCSYAGLTPTVSQSASTCHHGAISKEGSKHLRWILIESVHIHKRFNSDSQLSKFCSKIEKKRGKQKATTCSSSEAAARAVLDAPEQRALSQSWIQPRV